MFKKPLWQTVWTKIRSIGAVCSGSKLFVSILNLSVMLGNYLQRTTFLDVFFLGALRVNIFLSFSLYIYFETQKNHLIETDCMEANT